MPLETLRGLNHSQTQKGIKVPALGSDRAAKIMSVRGAMARMATIDAAWGEAKLVARPISITAPALPLTDWGSDAGSARSRVGCTGTTKAEANWDTLGSQQTVSLAGVMRTRHLIASSSSNVPLVAKLLA